MFRIGSGALSTRRRRPHGRCRRLGRQPLVSMHQQPETLPAVVQLSTPIVAQLRLSPPATRSKALRDSGRRQRTPRAAYWRRCWLRNCSILDPRCSMYGEPSLWCAPESSARSPGSSDQRASRVPELVSSTAVTSCSSRDASSAATDAPATCRLARSVAAEGSPGDRRRWWQSKDHSVSSGRTSSVRHSISCVKQPACHNRRTPLPGAIAYQAHSFCCVGAAPPSKLFFERSAQVT